MDYAKQFLGTPYVYGGNGMVINALPEEGVVYTPLETLYGEYSFHRLFKNTYGQ